MPNYYALERGGIYFLRGRYGWLKQIFAQAADDHYALINLEEEDPGNRWVNPIACPIINNRVWFPKTAGVGSFEYLSMEEGGTPLPIHKKLPTKHRNRKKSK